MWIGVCRGCGTSKTLFNINCGLNWVSLRRLSNQFYTLAFFNSHFFYIDDMVLLILLWSNKEKEIRSISTRGKNTYHIIIWRSFWGPLRGCVWNPIILMVFRRDTGNRRSTAHVFERLTRVTMEPSQSPC